MKYFSCIDNGGKRQAFTLKAQNPNDALKKAMVRARKNAKGDITDWNCKLNLVKTLAHS